MRNIQQYKKATKKEKRREKSMGKEHENTRLFSQFFVVVVCDCLSSFFHDETLPYSLFIFSSLLFLTVGK
jgi:hypothetical protein